MASLGGSMPSASSVFSAYASMSATVVLFRSMFYDLVPSPLRHRLSSAVLHLLKRRRTSHLTLVIEEKNGITRNEVYDAAETYLSSKISPNTSRLRISKDPKDNHLTIRFDDGEKISDCFEGIPLNWSLISSTQSSDNPQDPRCGGGRGGGSDALVKRFFQLSFDKQYREVVLGSYLPFVVSRSKAIKVEKKAVKLFTLGSSYSYGSGAHWESINLEHPATFEKLAMDPEQKRALIDDLDRFVRRKEFYKRVGRAWKRGYLLYGPPGTGKSSLVAALANYLRFDIYDLQLANIMRDSDLRKLLLTTSNSSILVIEDIDCSVELPERRQRDRRKPGDPQLTLSGLLNFVDGLWSSCGDERIIIFTTNHKEKLDPALLRPGRMDLHVHLSYCTPDGFRLLASNYLGVSPSDHRHHHLFLKIEQLMMATDTVRITPAQVAEELMKTEDANVALEGIVKLLKRKKDIDDDDEEAALMKKAAKRRRISNGVGGMDKRKAVMNCLLRRTKLAMRRRKNNQLS